MEQLLAQMRGGGGAPRADAATEDTAEVVHISSLSLLKMLKHGRAGVPMEVMGLMLGEFIDQYTVRCVDVFAMPQSGSSVTVEAVDPVYQQVCPTRCECMSQPCKGPPPSPFRPQEMLEMLKQTGRPEMVVGWYHSHPGFGCWLSSTDTNTQQAFQQLVRLRLIVAGS